jgi:hypothetical protein
MPIRQIFFCFQDRVHLCTKLRNRILYDTSAVLIGKEKVSNEVLMELIESKSKLMHSLVNKDFDPKDQQNFISCRNFSDDDDDDVFLALEDIEGFQAARIYLCLLRSIVLVRRMVNGADLFFKKVDH